MAVGNCCIVDPKGPCAQCSTKKQGCSLMPPNSKTGRTDHCAKSEAKLLQFHLNQVQLHAEAKRGKQHASNSPDSEEPEGSGLSPSPLAGIEMLTLSSGRSSAAHTPAEIPTAFPQPPLPDCHALAPTSGLL